MMKKIVLTLMIGFLLIGVNAFAVDGDLIVDGKVGIGTAATPEVKLHVEGDAIIESDSSKAFLVRKAGDGGNMFLVNTSETKYSSFKIDDSWNAFHFVKQNPEFNTLRFTNYAGGSSQPADIVLETAKGTAASPSSVGVGSGIGGFRLKARGSTNWPIVGEMKWVVQSISGNNIGTYVRIGTSTSGGTHTERLRIDQNGNVGIGTTNPGSYRLYVQGTAYSTGGWQSSDIRFKRKITSIDNALDKVLNLNGVSYEWKTNEYKDKGFPEGMHYGVIGQQVEKVLPAIVKEGPNGYKGVAYTEIIPVLIEAVKEQQKIIEELKSKVKQLETKDFIANAQ